MLIWGRTKSKAEKCAEGMGAGVVVCDSIEEAVKDADIVCTVTAATTPILKAEWIKPGAHINCKFADLFMLNPYAAGG